MSMRRLFFVMTSLCMVACGGDGAASGDTQPTDGNDVTSPADGADATSDGDAVDTASSAEVNDATSDGDGGDAIDAVADAIDDGADAIEPLPDPPVLASPALFSPAGTFGRIQVQPALALGGGTLVIAWAGFGEAEGQGTFARAWDVAAMDPTPMGEPARVNTDTRGIQNEPSLCRLSASEGDARFVVAWSIDTQETGPAGENLEVRFRLLDAGGTPLGASDTRVLTERPGNHWLAEVACREGGGFAIAGVRPNAAGSSFEVFAQGYDAFGAADGAPRVVEAITLGSQAFPAIGVGPGDRWVLALEDTVGADADTTIALRVLDPDPAMSSLLVDLVRRDGVDAMAPSVSVDPRSGAWIAGGVIGTRLVLRAGDAAARDIGEPIALPDPPTAVTTAHALTPVTTDGLTRHGLVYYRGTGANVAVRVVWIEEDTALGEADTAFEGSLPLAYRPAIACGDGRLVVAWTKSLGAGSYALGAALYR